MPFFLLDVGNPLGNGYDPLVQVLGGPLPSGVSTPDVIINAQLRALWNAGTTVVELSRVTTNIGGRQALIVEYKRKSGELPWYHELTLTMIAGNSAWSVDCITSPTKFGDFKDTFYAILSSFRVWK